jgi:hypothetical protein
MRIVSQASLDILSHIVAFISVEGQCFETTVLYRNQKLHYLQLGLATSSDNF